MVARIRKNDTVVVLSGKYKDKQGTVIQVSPKKDKIIVKGIAIVTRHMKARKQGEVSGIKKQEGFIQISNVMPVCTSCQKACRVGSVVLEDGKRVRTCKQCKEVF